MSPDFADYTLFPYLGIWELYEVILKHYSTFVGDDAHIVPLCKFISAKQTPHSTRGVTKKEVIPWQKQRDF